MRIALSSRIVGFALAVGLLGCGEATPSTSVEQPPVTFEASESTRAFVSDLRERFEATEANESALLPASEANGFRVEGDHLRPVFPVGTSLRAESLLAKNSAGFATIRALDESSGAARMSLSFRVAGASARAATEADGYVAYPGALPAATLLSRVSSEGIEDYVYFEQAPSAAEVRYQLELSDEVAGLRLVGSTLEALDEGGTPRLRLAPPFLVATDRQRVDATVDLEGCAADEDPTGPWDRPVTDPGSRRCTVVVRWDAAAVRYPALLDPLWSTTGNMATARANHTATYLSSTNRILVVGGTTTGGAPIATCELYNPSGAGTWSATANVPTTGVGRAYHIAVTLNNGTVFVAGGMRDGTNTTNTSAIYTPSSGAWTSKAQMSTARSRHAATVLPNGDVVITGGLSGSTTIQNVEIYRPTPNNWFAANSPTTARRLSHTSVRMSNGHVMIMGGRDGSTTLTSAYSYDPSINDWTPRGNLFESRLGHTATTLSNGDILVTGGGVHNISTVRATCDLYKNSSNTWQRTADMSFARMGHAATLLSNGSVVVSGGMGAGGSSAVAVKGAERFKPTLEIWSDEPTLNTARANHAAAVTSAGLVVAAGGITKTTSPTYLASAEKFTPSIVTSTAVDYMDGVQTSYEDGPQVNAANDPHFDTRVTEIKGTMYHPPLGTGVFPIVVMMHGNHASCGQTTGSPRIDDDSSYSGNEEGTDTGGWCPSGYAEVRSDKGYAYLAHELAQRGFVVFSIDANRGIADRNDGALPSQQQIDTRGRLALKTLQRIHKWNTVSGSSSAAGLPNLLDRVDLGKVGLFGHSRGGEAMRAAAYFYANQSEWQTAIPGLTVKGIFEVGSTDGEFDAGETPIFNDPAFIPWALLMGTCDSVGLHLPGIDARHGLRTFDRLVNNAIGFVGM